MILNIKQTAMLILLAASISAGRAEVHVFTNDKGQRITAEYQYSTATHVTVKLQRNDKMYTIPLASLSAFDREFVQSVRGTDEEEEKKRRAAEDKIAAADLAARKIVNFCNNKMGQQVGNGECWTLAHVAFTSLELPRQGQRIWGRKLDINIEHPRPGDILELESAQFSDGSRTGPNHTAIVIERTGRGVVKVAQQNWAGKKFVHSYQFDLKKLSSGKLMVYRYEGPPAKD